MIKTFCDICNEEIIEDSETSVCLNTSKHDVTVEAQVTGPDHELCYTCILKTAIDILQKQLDKGIIPTFKPWTTQDNQ